MTHSPVGKSISTISDLIRAPYQDEGPQEPVYQRGSFTLYLAAASALLGAIGMGAVLGWTAPAFESLSQPESRPRLLLNSTVDSSAKAWIGSSMPLGALLGALVSGPIVQSVGGKAALIGYALPSTLGWLLISLARSVGLIVIGRVITGFTAGLITGTVPSYLVEIAPVGVRGRLGASFQLFVVFGIFLTYLSGSFLRWNTLAGIAAIPALLMAVAMFAMPASPVWLTSVGRIEDAEEALRRLRTKESEVELELINLIEKRQPGGRSFGAFGMYKQRKHLVPLVLSMGLLVFQQFSGINAILFYSSDIFAQSASSLEPRWASLVISIAQLSATAVGSLLVDRLGRKVLLCTSALCMMLSTGALGLYYALLDGSSMGWVPVVSLVLFIVGFSLGFGPLPWLMIAEIAPAGSRSTTSALAAATNWACVFLVTKYFADLESAITRYGTFFLFSGFSLLAIAFVCITLPETKGKTAAEIERFFGEKQKILEETVAPPVDEKLNNKI